MKGEGAGKGDSYRRVDWSKFSTNFDSIFRERFPRDSDNATRIPQRLFSGSPKRKETVPRFILSLGQSARER